MDCRSTEAAYRFIARRRTFFYWLTRLTFGKRIEPARFAITQWLFLRLLAAIYIVAFASLAVQVTGLLGEHGISPAHDFFGRVGTDLGWMRFWAAPSVFWWNSTDTILVGAAWAGVVLGAVLLAGYLERLTLVLLYVLYLSFSLAGQEFLSFQWDALLLEVGFLAIFFGHTRVTQKNHRMAVSLAGVSPVFPVGICEAGQRRSELAQPERARFPLLDAAPADHLRLVRRQAAALVPAHVYVYGAGGRTRRAVSDLHAAADPFVRRGIAAGPGRPDLPDRQLHLLQPAGGGDYTISLR